MSDNHDPVPLPPAEIDMAKWAQWAAVAALVIAIAALVVALAAI